MLPRALAALLLLPLLCAPRMAAQGPPSAAPAKTPNFAQEPYILQQASTVYVYHADGTGYRERTVAVKIQSDAALRSFGVLSLPFASASERVDFRYVRVRHADGSVTETSLTGALEQAAPVTREAPFYSDLKEKQLPITGLRSGDTLEWQARIVRTVAEAPNNFWGQDVFVSEGVTLSDDVELRIPAATRIVLWTNPTGIASPTDTTTGGERVLHWHHANLKPTVGPEAEAAKKAAETHILTAAEETDANDGKLPSLAFTTFADWAAVGAWYRSLAAPRSVPDATIQAKAAELTAGLTTDDARARALYTYVATQIRYIGVAFGVGRYQPHSAADVLSNQYGDCKDKHTLLSALLAAVNIPSDAVLIGAGVRFNPEVPSPLAFNHLITRAHIGTSIVWLDTTTEVAPFQALIAPVRDKSALVIPVTAPAEIAKTPATLPYKPFSTFTVVGSLDKDLTSDSTITAAYRDDDEIVLRSVLSRVTIGQYGEFVQNFMGSLGFGGTTSQAAITNVADTTKPITLTFHYHRIQNPEWGKDRITAAFGFIGLPGFSDDHPPRSAIDLGLERVEDSTLELKLPEHFTAELPEAVHAHEPFAACDVTYRLDHDKLYAERKLFILQRKVPAASWPAYKAWYNTCGVGSVPYIQLIHLYPSNGSAESVPSKSYGEAANLVEEANEAVIALQPDKALELLDRAKAINPEQRGLWATYGARAYGLGIVTEAIEDYRKELKYHPDNLRVYLPLAEELTRSGKIDEAIVLCRKGVEADPANASMNGTLIYLLMQQGRNDEAATAGVAALKLVRDDDAVRPRLVITTAQAQVILGRNAEAAALLTDLLKTTKDPGIQNDAAYSLATTGLNLPAAEAASRASLESLGTETRAWTLDESPDTLKRKSSLLAASWDTYGYILFREGKLADARSYIEAAWLVRQSSEEGLHLGDILLTQKDPTSALHMYQLAQAALPGERKFITGKPPVKVLAPGAKPLSDKIDAGIALARKAGAKESLKDFNTELQNVRSLSLGHDGPSTGSAEYRVLLSKGKVERVHPIGIHTLPDADELLRSTTAFVELMPADSDARIVVTGVVNCSAGCHFILEP